MKYIIGIDEVGRGPLAGPVIVCALALPRAFKNQNGKRKIKEVKDSKQLTAKQREKWYVWIKNNSEIKYAVAQISPKTIDKINISCAANRAAYNVYKKLLNNIIYQNSISIILDAGLKLPKHISYKAIIKADEKYPAVAYASIIAKVVRDRYMARQHNKYPGYQFAEHKGYGTARHIKAIIKYGPCPLHRLTFIKNISILKK